MPLLITDARIAQVTATATALVNNFVPFDDEHTAEALLSIFDPKIEWYDHGFYNVRMGHEAVLGLHKTFLHCNQPFRAEIKKLLPTSEGCVLEQLWIGRCTNDIVRPNGEVVMKGSGQEFKTHVCMLLQIDEESGKITRIDEYDYRYWDEGRAEEEYTRIGEM